MAEAHQQEARILVCVPYMHAELVTRPLPQGTLFLDPGLAAGESAYTPDDLPLGPKEARRWLRDMLAFGAQAKRPADIAVFGAKPMEDFYTGTALDSKSEFADLKRLEQGLEPEAALRKSAEESAAEAALATARAAQMALLLAWHGEEQLLELMKLQQGVRERWNSFESVLGLGSGNEDEHELTGLRSTVEDMRNLAGDWPVAPWRSVLLHMARLLPADAGLVCCDPAMVLYWRDMGLNFVEPPLTVMDKDQAAFMDTQDMSRLVLSAPYWRLLGLDGPDADRPWLDTEPVVVIGGAGEA